MGSPRLDDISYYGKKFTKLSGRCYAHLTALSIHIFWGEK